MTDDSTLDWPFEDPKNVVCITTSDVMDGSLPIIYVGHDEDDGIWQFITSSGPDMNKAMVVGLGEICKVDRTIYELANLPLGWCAERQDITEPWRISKQPKKNNP